jgi:tRNA(Glu) U13 pseudouridine synthase TruD
MIRVAVAHLALLLCSLLVSLLLVPGQIALGRTHDVLELTFDAASGCYATSVLREIMKRDR